MSSVHIRKATLSDAEKIVTLLDQFYPGVPEHWQKLFAPRSFVKGDDYPGLILLAGEKVVGFLGTILSDHDTAKGRITLCNLSCWYVEPAYRQHSMPLFLKAMKLPGITAWTNLTAAPHTYEWFNRLGYESFIDKKTLIFPLPSLFTKKKGATATVDFSIADLPLDQQAIYHQHQFPHCKHVLIKKGNEHCYCIVVITKFKKIPLANLYYISHPGLFREVIADIRWSLCWKLKAAYLVMDGQGLKGRLSGIREKTLFPPRMFKSASVSKNEMTLLGSELFVLGI